MAQTVEQKRTCQGECDRIVVMVMMASMEEGEGDNRNRREKDEKMEGWPAYERIQYSEGG